MGYQTETENHNGAELLLAFVWMFIQAVITILFNAWVITKLYNWFLPPLLNTPVLHEWQVAGVLIVIGYIFDRTSLDNPSEKSFKRLFFENMFLRLFVGAIYLVLGLILKSLAGL